MAEPILNEARAKQNLAEPSIESNVKYELGEELLKELRRNTYSGRVEEDVVGHIAKILEILDLIKIAEGGDPLEFITWRNSKFKDHTKVDETTKRALVIMVEVEKQERMMDKRRIKRRKIAVYTNLSMIVKSELKVGDEFLKILHDNSFNGMDGSDVTDHIAKVL
ncbi:hypothetical protein Tco_0505237 [Tanacetum coccineum]